MLPKEIAKLVPKTHLMSESEWRSIGVQQSQGWIHYMKHDPGIISECLKCHQCYSPGSRKILTQNLNLLNGKITVCVCAMSDGYVGFSSKSFCSKP